MRVNWKWRLAVALLGLALMNPPGVAAKIKHFKDDQGTLHINNAGEAEAGKGNGTKLNMHGRRWGASQQAMAPMAPPPPPVQEAPPPEPVAPAPQEEEAQQEPVAPPSQEEAAPLAQNQEEAPQPIEDVLNAPQPDSGRSRSRGRR